MNNSTLRQYIRQVSVRMTEDEITLVAGCVKRVHLKKGEAVLKVGQVCRSFYLVEHGYLRNCYNKDGVTINLNFAFEGEYTTNLKSIRTRRPSEFTIEGGEDTKLWVFDLDVIANEFDQNLSILSFIRRVATHLLVILEDHSNSFKIYTPTERYHQLTEHNPRLLQRVSLSHIASYLGVTRETLSRIRGKKQ